MQIKKIIIEKSRTIHVKDRSYKKISYMLESQVEENEDVQAVRDHLNMLIEAWLAEEGK